MKLKNQSASKHEFSHVGKDGKMEVFSVPPGGELVVDEAHPLAKHLMSLPEKYPKDWLSLEEKKLSKAELEAELKKRDAEEKAEKAKADKAEKEKADAGKKAGADKDKASA